jgi:hypothetical protein
VTAAATGAASERLPAPASSLPIAALAGLLFVYVAWRASRLAITWDEAANYLEYTRKGLLSPFRFPFPHFGANNHFLNSWLTFLTTRLAGPGELSLRAPVLAAYLLFLYYTARLSRTFRSSLDATCAFGVLNLNPYLLDFFSLSRGYGLSYGLLAGSLWHLHEYLGNDFDRRHGLVTLGFAMLAVSAHLTLVHFLIALTGVVMLAPVVSGPQASPLLRRFRGTVMANLVALAAVGLFLVSALVVIRKLARAGAFFYGGRIGFWDDTILSVMRRSLYEQPYSVPQLLGVVSLVVTGWAALVAGRRWRRRRSPADLYLPALLALLLTCAVASIAQHHLLGVLYLTGRTALYLLVLWTIVLAVLFRELAPLHRPWQYALRAGAALLALHFVSSANGRSVLEWKDEAEVQDVLRDVAANRGSLPAGKPTLDLGASLAYEAPLNYYRAAAGLTWLNVVDRHARAHPLNDLYLVSAEDWRAFPADSFRVLRTYPLSHARLLQRRIRPARYLVTRSIMTSSRLVEVGDSSWRGILPVDLSQAPAARSLVAVAGAVLLERIGHTRTELAVRFRRGDRSYSWCGVSLQDYAVQSRTWYPLRLSCFIPADAQDGDVVTVTVDHRDTPIQLRRVMLEWLTAEY